MRFTPLNPLLESLRGQPACKGSCGRPSLSALPTCSGTAVGHGTSPLPHRAPPPSPPPSSIWRCRSCSTRASPSILSAVSACSGIGGAVPRELAVTRAIPHCCQVTSSSCTTRRRQTPKTTVIMLPLAPQTPIVLWTPLARSVRVAASRRAPSTRRSPHCSPATSPTTSSTTVVLDDSLQLSTSECLHLLARPPLPAAWPACLAAWPAVLLVAPQSLSLSDPEADGSPHLAPDFPTVPWSRLPAVRALAGTCSRILRGPPLGVRAVHGSLAPLCW